MQTTPTQENNNDRVGNLIAVICVGLYVCVMLAAISMPVIKFITEKNNMASTGLFTAITNTINNIDSMEQLQSYYIWMEAEQDAGRFQVDNYEMAILHSAFSDSKKRIESRGIDAS